MSEEEPLAWSTARSQNASNLEGLRSWVERVRAPSLGQIAAGSCGGIAHLLVVHPFDTIRTRLQTAHACNVQYKGEHTLKRPRFNAGIGSVLIVNRSHSNEHCERTLACSVLFNFRFHFHFSARFLPYNLHSHLHAYNSPRSDRLYQTDDLARWPALSVQR
jgi:hypothetical protein